MVYFGLVIDFKNTKVTASTKYLFSDDLAKQIRDAKETNLIGNAVGLSKHDYRPIHLDSSSPNRRSNAYKSGPANRQHFFGKGPHSTARRPEEIQQLNTQLKHSVSDFPLFIEATPREPHSGLTFKVVATLFRPETYHIP